MLDTSLFKRLLPCTSIPKYKGITLIELMFTVAIASIVSLIAIPSMSSFIVQLRVNNEISMLQRLLLTTRNYAINSGDRVILCPLTVRGSCTTDWHKELSVFVDYNNNQIFDAIDEKIITTKAAIKTGDKLIYGKGRTKVTYQPTGHLSGLSNGTFRYCPYQHMDMSRGIVIARSGRLYTTSDIDGESKDKTRMNKEITCN